MGINYYRLPVKILSKLLLNNNLYQKIAKLPGFNGIKVLSQLGNFAWALQPIMTRDTNYTVINIDFTEMFGVHSLHVTAIGPTCFTKSCR